MSDVTNMKYQSLYGKELIKTFSPVQMRRKYHLAISGLNFKVSGYYS